MVADLTELELDEQVDAVFSSAVFHWVLDHDLLFRAPADRAAPRWRDSPRSAAAPATSTACARSAPRSQPASRLRPTSTASTRRGTTPAQRRRDARLEAAGFEDVRCWLQPWTIEPPEPAEFLRTVCLGPHIDRLPEELRAPVRRAGARARARATAAGVRAPQHRGPRRCLSATVECRLDERRPAHSPAARRRDRPRDRRRRPPPARSAGRVRVRASS